MNGTPIRTVAIVIPTHDNLRLLLECLSALRGLTYPREAVEVIVVDDASTDGTAAAVGKHPGVKLIRLEKNVGFGVACNRGATEAESEYVAFLNDDAVPQSGWLEALFAALNAGDEGTVCAASHIRSRDGEEVEYDGASANLFGVGRPRPTWGWPNSPHKPGEGTPVLFASGGAMLVHRRTFHDVGGFDPHFFMYFEDVDLGWRLWTLGYKVVYAPDAVVRHVGGATGSRSPDHRRYTLWECNSLATVLKNYESGNMERILSTALMLLYKRALLAAGDAIQPDDYRLGGPPDTNATNVERISQVSVAHLAAINRFNSRLPYFMEERRRIQAARKRPDSEVLPLLGRAWEPQFAGTEYAKAAHQLARSMRLHGIPGVEGRNRVLILASPAEKEAAAALATRVSQHALAAVALVDHFAGDDLKLQEGFTLHTLPSESPTLRELVRQADALLLYPGASGTLTINQVAKPVITIGQAPTPDDRELVEFCIDPYANLPG